MKVLVISGFLGAGKTTFIKEILKHTTHYAAVLENEFGDINLDSMEISSSSNDSDLQILDFSEGCVCCSQKDSFIYSVLNISSCIDPDYLIVEPSGVAKLGNLMAGLEKIRYDKIDPIKPVVIVSLPHFFSNLNSYKDLMENQIRNAGFVVYSKSDNAGEDTIEKVTEMILSINPDIQISGSYTSESEEGWWLQFMQDDSGSSTISKYDEEDSMDSFEQISISDLEFGSIGDIICFCEEILRGRYQSIARVKGNISVGDQILKVDIADDTYIITEGAAPLQMVFIGKSIDRIELYRRCKKNLKTGYMFRNNNSKGFKKITR